MNVKRTTKISLSDALERQGETDWKRVAEDDDSVVEPDDFDWAGAKIVMPERKKAVSLRLDQEVLEYFKLDGKGYQTRINSVLKAYMKAHQG